MSSTDFPFNAVVYLTDVVNGIGYQASGVLISPDEVLTAAHVVYQAGIGTASNIQVTPGYNKGARPFGTASGLYYHYYPISEVAGTLAKGESQTDFAVIHLNRSFSQGYMGVEADYSGGAVHVTAYPSRGLGAQVDVTENITKDPLYHLFNGVDTGAGSSGGPVWEVHGDGSPFVVGLVSSGTGIVGYDSQITAATLAQIQAWVFQDDYYDPLVDSAYYRAANPDVAAAPLSASYHYDFTGWREGRDPSAYFTTSGYLGANPDVRAAGLDPLAHYDQFGWREGRDPAANFDTSLYLLHNQDVAAAGIDPLMHFLLYGRVEGRAAYAALGTPSSIGGGFDPEYYLLANPDVAAAGVDPATHFFTTGWHEGRNPDAFFDTRGYLAAYPDVAAAGVNPLVHYDASGWREGRDPSANFDTKTYLRVYGDVAAAGLDPLQHWLQYGAYEFRATFADNRFG